MIRHWGEDPLKIPGLTRIERLGERGVHQRVWCPSMMVSCLSSSERGFHTHSNRKRFIRFVSSKHTKKCNFWRENIQKKKDGGGGGGGGHIFDKFQTDKVLNKNKTFQIQGAGVNPIWKLSENSRNLLCLSIFCVYTLYHSFTEIERWDS